MWPPSSVRLNLRQKRLNSVYKTHYANAKYPIPITRSDALYGTAALDACIAADEVYLAECS